MSRVTIRRIDVIRAANIAAVLYAVIVAIVGLLFFLPLTLLVGVAGSRVEGGGAIAGAGIVGALLFTLLGIVIYGVIGWIMTAIMVALYNLVAGRVGGIQADVEIQGPYGMPGYGGPGYPAPGYPAPGYGNPAWPAPGTPGGPVSPPPGWGQPG